MAIQRELNNEVKSSLRCNWRSFPGPTYVAEDGTVEYVSPEFDELAPTELESLCSHRFEERD